MRTGRIACAATALFTLAGAAVARPLVPSGITLPHPAAVNAIAFAPDGTLFATGCDDGLVRLWNTADGREVRRLEGHEAPVLAVAFAPAGSVLATAGGEVAVVRGAPGEARDTAIRLWDPATGKLTGRLEGLEYPVTSLAFAPDGATLASTGVGNAVLLWNLGNGRRRVLEGHTKRVASLAYFPDGKSLASASDDHTVRVWDVMSGRQMLNLEKHQKPVTALALSSDARFLASSGLDREVIVWEVISGRPSARLAGHESWTTGVAFSPDGDALFSTGLDGTLRAWDVLTGRAEVTPTGAWGLALAVSPTGRGVAAGLKEKGVTMWATAPEGPRAPPEDPGSAPEALWGELGATDPAVSRVPVAILAARLRTGGERGARAASFLRDRLAPFTQDRIRRLLRELDHDDFGVRERASSELALLGAGAEPFFREALEADPSAEVRSRIEQLLETAGQSGILLPDMLRAVRAIESLERAATPEAREILEGIAAGDPVARESREAAAAIARLGRP